MTYIVTLNGEIYGVYDTIDLVRTNLMIIFFFNLEKGNIGVDFYEKINEYFIVPQFSEQSLEIPDLKSDISGLGIHILKAETEKNGTYALEKIMNHINWRFMDLEKKMNHDSRVKITFPGDNSENHQLGIPYAGDWKLIDRDNWKKLTDTLHKYIGSKIRELEKKFPPLKKGDNRIRFGEVLYDNATETSIQVWSANAVNWNLPKGTEIPGLYQAEQMKFQEPGVFGIVVTPIYGYHSLVPSEYEN
jgi:hypothetical protein